MRIEIDVETLVDELFAYVTDPRPARNRFHHAILDEIQGPGTLDLSTEFLESMILDGVRRRQDVADLVLWATAEDALCWWRKPLDCAPIVMPQRPVFWTRRR